MTRDFWTLVAAETVSELGSQVSLVALPLTAVLLLHANSAGMSLLTCAGAIPTILLGPVAGMVIDGLDKRRVLIAANVISAVVIALVPATYASGILSMFLLLFIALVSACFSNVEGIALLSIIPSIVAAPEIARANGYYNAIRSAAPLVGPAVAGILIGILSAPVAILIDAVSFLISAIILLPLPKLQIDHSTHSNSSTVERLKAGFVTLTKNASTRGLMSFLIIVNIAGSVFVTLQPILIVRQLHVSPSLYGLALMPAGVGAIAGASLSGRVVSYLGLVGVIFVTALLLALNFGGIVLLKESVWLATVGFAAANLFGGLGGGLINASGLTHVQTSTPSHLHASAIGALLALVGVSMLAGAIAAGVLGNALSVRQALLATTAAYILALIPLFGSLVRLRQATNAVQIREEN